MTIEVGKSYIDINDDKVDLIYKDLTNNLFIGIFKKNSHGIGALGFFDNMGRCVASTLPCISHLVKEYKKHFNYEIKKVMYLRDRDAIERNDFISDSLSERNWPNWIKVKAHIILEEIID